MTRYLIIVLFILLQVGCSQPKETEFVSGDLYFMLIDLYRVFDAPDSILDNIESSLDKVDLDTISANEKKYYNLLKYATDNDLLRQPYIWIRIDSLNITRLFVDSKTYKSLEDYSWNDLKRENKKVHIEAQAIKQEFDSIVFYQATKVTKIEEVEGRTYWKK